jgi:phage tail-like protein
MRAQHSFLVRFADGQEFAFKEVFGLESPTAEQRAKIHGIHKPDNVTLRRGVIASSATFWDWSKHPKPQRVVIKLLDEHGSVAATWKVTNAWPLRVTPPDFNAKGNDVAIESVELVHEGLELLP